jgi:hypothetical protein
VTREMRRVSRRISHVKVQKSLKKLSKDNNREMKVTHVSPTATQARCRRTNITLFKTYKKPYKILDYCFCSNGLSAQFIKK